MKRLLIVLKFYRLNHNSSRSHCIFTVKMVRVADKDQPHMARVSMLSFCDLAGSERIKKTMNTGDRQKEAGNINTSLLVLGRCIKAIRHNQMIKDVRKHQIIPYRDSKLTRLFQSYFTGCGKVSMIVNISQSSYLFDEVSTFTILLQFLGWPNLSLNEECTVLQVFCFNFNFMRTLSKILSNWHIFRY